MEIKKSNKILAKNTLFMYSRMFIGTFISLYTSRIILQIIGITDYGIYNVIAGVVVIFSFINSSMATSTSRFIAFAIGEGRQKEVDRIFFTTLILHIVLCILFLLCGETVGLWYVQNRLVVPINRINITPIIYHLSLFSCIWYIISVPLTSMIIANEKMNVYAYMSIFDVVAKLLIVFSLSYISYDKLVMYSFLQCILSVVSFFFYFWYVIHSKMTTIRLVKIDIKKAKEIISYCSFTLAGSFANVLNTQGLNVFLNFFFGPIINAAYGIMNQVQGSVNNLSRGFQTALNPQIVKTYASQDINRHRELLFASSRYSVFLISIAAIPIIFNINKILLLWLGKYPYHTPFFIQISIISCILCTFGNPFGVSIEASGNIKTITIYTIVYSAIVLPLSYFAIKLSNNPGFVLLINLLSTLIIQIYKIKYCRKFISFNYSSLWNVSIYPILKAIIVSTIVCFLISLITISNYWISLIIIILECIVVIICSYLFGLTDNEKSFVKKYINNKVKFQYKNKNEDSRI